MNIDDKVSSSSLNKVETRVYPVVQKKSVTRRCVGQCASKVACTSTTTAPDTKARPVKEKREKDTEGVKEKERGEGPITKKRKLDDDDEESDVMPSPGAKKTKREWKWRREP